MSDIAEHDMLYLQGQALGDSSHDQRSWTERLKAEQPPEVSVAAGVLASHVTAGNEQYGRFIASELYNAGLLKMPEALPAIVCIRN